MCTENRHRISPYRFSDKVFTCFFTGVGRPKTSGKRTKSPPRRHAEADTVLNPWVASTVKESVGVRNHDHRQQTREWLAAYHLHNAPPKSLFRHDNASSVRYRFNRVACLLNVTAYIYVPLRLANFPEPGLYLVPEARTVAVNDVDQQQV